MANLVIQAVDTNLDIINQFIHSQLEGFDYPPTFDFQLDLAVEEIFVNIAHYAYAPDTGEVEILCSVEKNENNQNQLIIVFKDSGVHFDPLARPDPDPTAAIEERGIGGWGIFLTKKYMDKVTYAHVDGKNTLTLTKIID